MHMIVDTGGSVPPARWSLVNEYFEILRRRVKAKGGETQRAIERNWSLLGPIHQRAGLALHAFSEGKGGANSSFDRIHFERLLRVIIWRVRLEENEVADRTRELLDLALNRLVLLSAREEGRIGFDVRSFQEFMVAAGARHLGRRRDRRGASCARRGHRALATCVPHRREPVLLRGRIHYRRSSIASIARGLECSEPDLLVRNGARLALDMLQDGLGTDHPVSRRQLALHALEILSLGPPDYDGRLPTLWENTTSTVIEDALHERLRGGTTPSALGAWRMLVALARRNPGRFGLLVEHTVPTRTVDLVKVLLGDILPLPSVAVVSTIRERFLNDKPQMLFGGASAFLALLHTQIENETVPHHPLIELNITRAPGLSELAIGLLSVAADSLLAVPVISVNDRRFDVLLTLDGKQSRWTSSCCSGSLRASTVGSGLGRCFSDLRR